MFAGDALDKGPHAPGKTSTQKLKDLLMELNRIIPEGRESGKSIDEMGEVENEPSEIDVDELPATLELCG